MGLSDNIVSLFVNATNDKKEESPESTLYGTTVYQNGRMYVQLDGSGVLTPVSTTAATSSGERVMVMIKNHTATVTGNLTSPSASQGDVADCMKTISEFETLMSYKITTEDLSAVYGTIENLVSLSAHITSAEMVLAEIETLRAEFAELSYVDADKVEALNADIESLRATFATIADLSTEEFDAINAEIDNLRGYTADYTYVSAEFLSANKANIEQLETKKLDSEEAKITYANIDFSNIGKAAMEYLYATSGLIENVTIDNGTITGMIVGVTIRGDLIEGNTIMAEKLVIKGEDGLYYKLNTDGVTTEAEQTEYNSLDGNVILAKSITATKISVSDLVAFDATIGGFNITDDSIYSEVKDSEGNTTRGIYMNKDGEFNFGDGDNYVKYYRDENGNYRLAISAETILYNINGQLKSIADLGIIGEYVQIGTYEGEPCIELGEVDSDFKLVITNTRIMFMEGTSVPAYISNQSLFIKKAVIEEELQQGGFVWKARSNGNLGLVWKGVTS